MPIPRDYIGAVEARLRGIERAPAAQQIEGEQADGNLGSVELLQAGTDRLLDAAGRESCANTAAITDRSQGWLRSSERETCSMVSINIDSHNFSPPADRHR